MSTRKIDDWHTAGLIDAETRARILAYEADHSRPLALWAVFGIGALTIGLGLISVVAANWEDIPGQLRLAIHLALIIAALAAVSLRERALAAAWPWASEALLFVAAILGLTFFGHLGQVYQTTSPLWKPLTTWLVLFAPLLLWKGRSWLIAACIVGTAIYAAWEYNWAAHALLRGDTPPAYSYLLSAFVTSLPLLFAPLGAAMRGSLAQRGADRAGFWRRIEQLGLIYAVVGASFYCVLASMGELQREAIFGGDGGHILRAVLAMIAGVLVILARPGISGQMSGAIIAGAGLTAALAFAFDGVDVLAALIFMVLWAGIAAAALYAGWRGVFQFAVAVIALRLIVLSFELASDLLLSGFGLILSGLMILVIAWGAVRVSREYAPPSEALAEVTGEDTP
jgi:uncharacterized membrane protein